MCTRHTYAFGQVDWLKFGFILAATTLFCFSCKPVGESTWNACDNVLWIVSTYTINEYQCINEGWASGRPVTASWRMAELTLCRKLLLIGDETRSIRLEGLVLRQFLQALEVSWGNWIMIWWKFQSQNSHVCRIVQIATSAWNLKPISGDMQLHLRAQRCLRAELGFANTAGDIGFIKAKLLIKGLWASICGKVWKSPADFLHLPCAPQVSILRVSA